MASSQVVSQACYEQALVFLSKGEEHIADGFLREAARYHPLNSEQMINVAKLKELARMSAQRLSQLIDGRA